MQNLFDTEYESAFEFEAEFEYEDEFEFEDDFEFESDQPFDTTTETELAAELLTVGDDNELEFFLGKLFKKATHGAKRFARSKVGKLAGGMLKNVAKQALPMAGQALGSYYGGAAGGQLGGQLGGMAAQTFELELEGLSPEDQEFEVARRVVRLAGETARQAARVPRSVPAREVARQALRGAARKHAPGLLRRRSPGRSVAPRGGFSRGASTSGTWVRRGNTIIVNGV